jgi:Sulfotransferase family
MQGGLPLCVGVAMCSVLERLNGLWGKGRSGMAMPWSIRVAGALPHEVARGVYRVASPKGYARFMTLRETVADSPGVPSFQPFLEHKCIFVSVPKCAGLAMADALFGGVNRGTHLTISHYKLAFSKEEFDSFFKFAFVRNPWDRVVSAYHYLRDDVWKRNDCAQRDRVIRPYPSFRDFVLEWLTETNVQTAMHFRPQYQFVCTSERGEPVVDFVGRFERLEQDFEVVRSRIGSSRPLAMTNRSRRRPQSYRSAYDDEMVERVARAYRRDIELFDYAF